MDQEASTSFPVAPLEGRTPLVPEGYDWEYPPWTFGFDLQIKSSNRLQCERIRIL